MILYPKMQHLMQVSKSKVYFIEHYFLLLKQYSSIKRTEAEVSEPTSSQKRAIFLNAKLKKKSVNN